MLLALLYYRATTTFSGSGVGVLLARFVVFVSEALLSFLWVLSQPFRWRPMARTVFPKRLPTDEKLPSIDVFVCTADPEKDPAKVSIVMIGKQAILDALLSLSCSMSQQRKCKNLGKMPPRGLRKKTLALTSVVIIYSPVMTFLENLIQWLQKGFIQMTIEKYLCTWYTI